MKISIKKIIKILEDAERDFRKRPNTMINNYLGLCYYIKMHELIKDHDYSDKMAYLKKVLWNHFSIDYYIFCNGESQFMIWSKNLEALKYERADWAAEQLEYFRNLLKQGEKA